ncbi:MAG: transglutaminase family protein, partial [Bryobacteraceae bacterium]
MAIQVALNHRTVYKYEKPVTLGPQVVRLRPAPHCRTRILSYSMKVVPAKHSIHWQQDPYNNSLARLVFSDKTQKFEVEVDLIAEIEAVNPFDYFLEPEVQSYPFEYPPALAKDLEPYRALSPAGPLLDRFLNTLPTEKQSTVGFLVDLNSRVSHEVGYVVRLNPGIQNCEETLGLRTGSCRDSGWLLVEILRQLGFAARFVSGYLIQLAPDETGAGEPANNASDSADLHAWAEVFLPGAGWIGFDPTSGLAAAEGHIPLASTPDASSAAPITGSVEPSKVDFSYSMSVRRVNQTPRVTKPYTADQWRRIQDLGYQVDRELTAQDVRLTMGGEPTFVGIDEPDSPQWNGDAMGPLKRERAVTLIRRIQERMAPGALLHFGQGKWYPGEPLPRWALTCAWRTDGVPIWENRDFIAREDFDYNFGTDDALEFMEALTKRLEVSSNNIIPAYEDAFFYLWRERRLPINVSAADSKLQDARQREELARVFERGLAEAVGYVLPIRRRRRDGRLYWSSQLWFLRQERLLLMSGDSPIGYRLPLDSLPWVAPDDIEYDYDSDPFADRGQLPRPEHRMNLFDIQPGEDPLPAESTGTDPSKPAIRPALCVEARQGRLHVFMPYTPRAEDYLEMLTAVEDTCRYLEEPVWIEGYPPPADPRLRTFSITPDPGVIEINLPPASSWDELEQVNTLVFEEARQNRLAAEKFMYDGRHAPTGGGNHIVIGGPTAGDSPLLRRPDLLRSMLTFWQNHPSLSYLFSGAFIGPTSQYPRIDEARMDALYELEIAFNQLPSRECSPWLVDRLFRNLLVDMTGNTHRAEFCIDKLYPPEGSGSRLGLLELRAFEMAPDVRMGLAELLLVRALIAMFWKTPYQAPIVRWGTALHDRFLLPHFIKQDFVEALAVLERFGYELDPKWFAPHLEFRFPRIGS